jgi:hypothetical protein
VGNVIIFCDACNKCWHQRCHEPQVPQSIIADSKAEWFCAECDRILHGKKNKKAISSALPTSKPATPPNNIAPASIQTAAFSGPAIPGLSLTHAQKQTYLSSLSKEKLISLILSASELAPALPLFQAATPVFQPQPKFTSNYTTPAHATANQYQQHSTTNHNNTTGTSTSTTINGTSSSAGNGHAATAPENDEGYDSQIDDHANLYPKPGNGVYLPPESTDLHILLEGKASKTFSHWVRGMVGREFSGTGDVNS